MIDIKEAIIVEGKYDKMQLERICSSPVFTTEGFRIFKDKEKREFLKKLAKKSAKTVDGIMNNMQYMFK